MYANVIECTVNIHIWCSIINMQKIKSRGLTTLVLLHLGLISWQSALFMFIEKLSFFSLLHCSNFSLLLFSNFLVVFIDYLLQGVGKSLIHTSCPCLFSRSSFSHTIYHFCFLTNKWDCNSLIVSHERGLHDNIASINLFSTFCCSLTAPSHLGILSWGSLTFIIASLIPIQDTTGSFKGICISTLCLNWP